MPVKAKLGPGRPSKLTPKQLNEIRRRLATGESTTALAREYGVAKATISGHCSQKVERIKDIASQMVSAEQKFECLPVSEQAAVINLVDQMKATSNNLAAAARAGSATSAHLAGIAHGKAVQLNPVAPDPEELRMVSALTQTANQAATIGTALIAFPKNSRLDEAPPKPKSAYDLSLLSNEALKVIRHLYKKAEGGPVKVLDRYGAENLIRAFEKCMAEVKEAALQQPEGVEP
jgi:DNA-binding transcriptional regulator YdaS (Cro superfamily)